MSLWFLLLAQASILAYALVGGVFLAFSDFIMRALSHAGGVEAMQTINREVFRWVFMALFIGLAPVSLGIAGFGWVYIGGGPGLLMVLAGLVYFVGCFGVTVIFNVPMNEALAKMDPGQAATEAYWSGTYLPRWTFWNSVRTVATSISAALMMFALIWLAQKS